MGMYLASPWPRQDLFFLNDALRHGGSFAEIASFLCRDEDEVREKARELKLIGPASVWPFDHDGGADHVGRSPLPSRTPQHVGELAPLHSITSSARASSVGAISKPNAFAVLRLMISSNLAGCSTGRSAGLT